MNTFLRIDINIIAIILLFIIVIVANKRLDKEEQINRVFIRTSTVVICGLFFEAVTCVINAGSSPILTPFANIFHVFLFISSSILTYFWYLLISTWVMPRDKNITKTRIFVAIPSFINVVLSIISPWYGFIFYIDSENVYHRGSLFILAAAIVYSYFIYSFLLIISKKNKIIKEEFLPLAIFGILPLIGGVLQTLFYGVLLMWSSAAFSLVIVYVFLQQRMVHIDPLTGAWTRGSFEYCIAERVKRYNKHMFGMIFIDLDGLKKINDEFGHAEGDCALKTTVALVKSVLTKSDIVARAGGDEFFIVLDCATKDCIDEIAERMQAAFDFYNMQTDKKYKLTYSIGAELCSSNFKDSSEFVDHLDRLMYMDKKNKKL